MALKIVVDTNVLVSALLKKGGSPDQLLRRWLQEDFLIVTCPAALVEIAAVLARPKIRQRYNLLEAEIDEFLQRFRSQTLIVSGTTLTGIVRADPRDDMFISTAVEGEARYLVSGDRHLLDLQRYQRILILTPTRFLARLERLARWRI